MKTTVSGCERDFLMKTSGLILLAFLIALSAGAAEVAWTYTPPSGYVDTSPATGDLTGDGHIDMVVGTTSGLIMALDGQGKEIWRQEMRGPICSPPGIGDLTGNAGLEVLAMNRQGQILCLSGATGEILWNAALPGRLQWGETAFAIGDVDGDGLPEIVTGDRDGNVVCFRGTGEMLWHYQGGHGITNAPAIADVTGDGRAEVFVGGDKIPLLCLSWEGKELWRVEGGIGGSPLLYDLNGDGTPEILLGIGDKLTALDATGKALWTVPMQREMDAALSVADADRDGVPEIYAVDLAGRLLCVSPSGQVRWTASVEERARRSPSIGDVDGDGVPEILVAGYSGALHVFEPDGRLKERIPLPGNSNATATLLPLREGGLQVIVPLTSEALRALRWPSSAGEALVLWPEHRFDALRSGMPRRATPEAALELEVDFGDLYAGANVLKALVHNPEGRRLTVRLESARNEGKPSESVLASEADPIEHQLSYTVPSDQAINLALTCEVLENDRILARRTHRAYLVPFAKEINDATRTLAKVELVLPDLLDRMGLEDRAVFLRTRADRLREDIATAGALPDSDRIALRDEIAALLQGADALGTTVKAAELAAGAGSPVIVCGANPWAPFGGMDEIAEDRFGAAELLVEAFGGETESAALNIFNCSAKPRTFRVEIDDLTMDDATVPAREAIRLHEVIDVPTEMRDYAADALPALNPARLIQVPAWGARQLWLNVDTESLAAGDWTGRIRLRSLEVESLETGADLKIRVWAARLPEEQPLRLCHWGYVHNSMLQDYPDEALADQVRNGTNVFVGLFYPRAQYDEQGNLIGEIDFSAHDGYVKKHAPHGMILFFNYQTALKGPGGIESEAYAKAHVQWLRAWVAHLRELGVGYDGFALYPVDEPGLSDGLSDRHVLMGKLAREADPKILLYTDPVGRVTEEELHAMLPYVDIWCPNRNGLILDKTNASKLEIIRNSGATVWTYECDHNAKHQSPLGYYRAQAWLAWHLDMTGIGFWSYCTSRDDPWFLPTLRHDYLLVYPGDGVVSSKRWEAIRDGVEDYTLLAALRQRMESPPPGTQPGDIDAAKRVLTEYAEAVAQFCGLDDDDTVPGPGGLPEVRQVADRRWETIQSVRREIARLMAP
jgi:outer membrane protein assembly factor BamB